MVAKIIIVVAHMQLLEVLMEAEDVFPAVAMVLDVAGHVGILK